MFLYLLPFNGISGDMLLGALIDLGLDPEDLFEPIRNTGVCFTWDISRVSRCGIAAIKVDVNPVTEDHHGNGDNKHAGEHRGLVDILSLVDSTHLPPLVKERAGRAFSLLAEVEAGIHGKSVDDIHFHEVGAVDSIVDITACLYGVHLLGVEGVYTEPVALGSGWVECAHGRIPVPAPATVRLLEGLEFFRSGREGELVTPTGALLLKILQAEPLPNRSFIFSKTSYGAGSREGGDFPNVLRAHLVEQAEEPVAEGEVHQVVFDVDDMTGEALGFLRECLEAAGVAEVAVLPGYYKKNRPGWNVQALVPTDKLEEFTGVVFNSSSTTGFRMWPVNRRVLHRKTSEVPTPHGAVKIKTSRVSEKRSKRKVEYEDAADLARALGVQLSEAQSMIDRIAEGDTGNDDESPETH